MKTIITTFGALALAATLCIAADKPQGGRPGGPGPGGPGGPGKPGGPDGHRPKPEEVFKKLDANNDSAVSLDEFKAGPMAEHDPVKAEEHFKKMDKDGNGSLTLEEFKTGRPPRPPGGRPGGPDGERKGKGPGGPKPPQ